MASSFQHSMPLRNHRTAPIFDSSNPHSLRRYFQDLLWLFEACGVSSDTKRKQYATYYLPITESDVWTSLFEYDDSQTDFEAFQVAIFALYPETSLDRLYDLSGLQKLVSQMSQADLSSLESLATFHRRFLAHSSFLLRQDRISPREQSQMFLDAIPSRFRSQIASRLELKFPDHYFDDTHPLSRIFEAAKFVYTFPSSQAVPELSLQPPAPSFDVSNQISRLSLPLDVAKLLEQATKSILDPIIAQLTAAAPELSYSSKLPPVSLQTIPIASTPPVRVPKSPRCFYCAEAGHTIQACPKVEEDLALGRCSRTQLGRVVLPSGAEIPRGLSGESLRERLFKSQQSFPSSLELQSSSEGPTIVGDGSPNSRAMLFVDSFAQLKADVAEPRRTYRPRPRSSSSTPPSFLPSSTSPPSSQTPPASSQSSYISQNIATYPSTVFLANSRRKPRVSSQSLQTALLASQDAPASSKSHFVTLNSLQSLPISQAIPSNCQHSISPKIAPTSSEVFRDRHRSLAEHRSTCSEPIDAFSTSIFSLSHHLCPQSSSTSPAAALPSPQLPLSSQSSQTSPALSQSANMSPAALSSSHELFPLSQNLQTSSQHPLDLVSTQELRSTSQMSPEPLSSQLTSPQVVSESLAQSCTFPKSTSYLPAQQSPPDLAESTPASQTAQTSYLTPTSIRFSSEDSQEQSVEIQSSNSYPKVVDFDTWLRKEDPGIVLRRNQSQASKLPLQLSLYPSPASQLVPASSKLLEPVPKSSQHLSASPSRPSCAQPSIPWQTRPNLSEIVTLRRISFSERSSTSFESIDADSTSISTLSLSASPQAMPLAVAGSPSSFSSDFIAEAIASPHSSSNTPPTPILDSTPREIAPKVPIDFTSPQASSTCISDTLSTIPDVSQVENRSQTSSKVVESRLELRQVALDVSRHKSLPTPPESPKSTPASISTRFSKLKASPTASIQLLSILAPSYRRSSSSAHS
ncbi:hypothetical protein NLI96_g12798 [Meripilus lineatus]|uniref:CCHC-type domain-containing protein n=1 Tax=Meripilus lineatus TaxID=2056292 RepID=A0AAD5UPF1_9APHY|nr:hypothetical protein NLI96_g12798 [Physisporinus lineatus]